MLDLASSRMKPRDRVVINLHVSPQEYDHVFAVACERADTLTAVVRALIRRDMRRRAKQVQERAKP